MVCAYYMCVFFSMPMYLEGWICVKLNIVNLWKKNKIYVRNFSKEKFNDCWRLWQERTWKKTLAHIPSTYSCHESPESNPEVFFNSFLNEIWLQGLKYKAELVSVKSKIVHSTLATWPQNSKHWFRARTNACGLIAPNPKVLDDFIQQPHTNVEEHKWGGGVNGTLWNITGQSPLCFLLLQWKHSVQPDRKVQNHQRNAPPPHYQLHISTDE